MEKTIFNREEVATYLGVSVRTISNWMNEGKIPFWKTGEARQCRTFFSRSAIDKFIEDQASVRVQAPSEPDVARRRPRSAH